MEPAQLKSSAANRDGRSGPGLRRWRRRLCLAALAATVVPKLAFVAFSALCPFPQRHLARLAAPAAAPRVLDRQGGLLGAFVTGADSWCYPVALAQISPRLIQATIAVEDKRFYHHNGVDWLALGRAAWSNLSRMRTVSGASTITMQTIRLLEPRRRTLWAKCVEAFRALQLEELRTKDEILAGYLNLAPYGGNLVGVEAASLAWFGKRAKDLTTAEAALLAGLPQAPSRLRPDRFPERAVARRAHVLRQMAACGYIEDSWAEAGHVACCVPSTSLGPGPRAACQVAKPRAASHEPRASEAAPDSSQQAVHCFSSGTRHAALARARSRARGTRHSTLAPHFAQYVRQRHPGRAVLRTTLEPGIQRAAEDALREGVDALRQDGVTNGAVVVIENASAALRAMVGSCDFFSREDDGQVNGATAPRAPGSALKPFTYALAFQRGLCTPATILPDVPSSYTGYEPANYDRDFRGAVSAREALAASLNIPAVRLLSELGHRNLHGLLTDLGLTTLRRDADHYGLALTLGSVEVTLLELTNAYATLARLGLHRPLRFLEEEPVSEGRRILSEGAAYLVTDILSDTQRLLPRPRFRMAWKTGTSHGHRDAWTIAYTPRHTVGVWLGNFRGRPARGLVGVTAATPIAARIMAQLEEQQSPAWFEQPREVLIRALCATSGLPSGPHCPRTVPGLALARSPSEARCTVHIATRVDPITGERLCPRCMEGREAVVRVAEAWPAELAAWLRRHGQGANLLPAHNSRCGSPGPSATRTAEAPRILSPADSSAYVLVPDGGPQRLTLRAAGHARTLYWFVGDTLFATAGPLEPAFWPLERGTHRITCADDAGHSASVTICVR